MEKMPIRKYFIDDLIFLPPQLEISHLHLRLGLVYLLAWIKCDQHFILLSRRWLRKLWKLFKLWHCHREVTGDIAIVKNTHCLHNVIANFGKERSNNHNVSSFPLLLYFVCQKQVYKSQLHFAARSPVSISSCPCFFCGSPCQPGACTARPCFSRSLIKSHKTNFMLSCTLASCTV